MLTYNEKDCNCLAKPDLINSPPHYTVGGIEAIDVIEAWELNFRLANVVKYVSRADRKGTPLDDLKKARWYLDREIKKRENGGGADLVGPYPTKSAAWRQLFRYAYWLDTGAWIPEIP